MRNEFTAVIERDGDGRPVRVVGTHINIDSRKRAEKKLADYRDRLEAMVRDRTRDLEQTSSLLEATLNAIPDVLGVQDEEHRILRYNEAGYRMLGKTPKEVVGKRCYELIGRKSECDGCAAAVAQSGVGREHADEQKDQQRPTRVAGVFGEERGQQIAITPGGKPQNYHHTSTRDVNRRFP